MDHILFLSIVFSLFVVLLLIYKSCLSLFPQKWQEKVNRNEKSLNPKFNNNALTGALIIILASIAFVLWCVFFAGLLL